MLKDKKVSLWLGTFSSGEEFNEYVEIKFDEDGNYIKSGFQKDFQIDKYDFDSVEKDWIMDSCEDVFSLLSGFSYDNEIIPKFEKMISIDKLRKYNSIILLYNFQYDECCMNRKMDYIGCVDVE